MALYSQLKSDPMNLKFVRYFVLDLDVFFFLILSSSSTTLQEISPFILFYFIVGGI